MARSAPWPVSRLRPADLWPLAVLGLVSRPARAALSAVGVALGLTLALNVDVIVPFLEQTFGFHIMDPEVYYMSDLPSEVHAGDVVRIGIAALALTLTATVYPALQAARTQPAEALRYE